MKNREKTLIISGWMVSELGLSGNSLLVYAVIYEASQMRERGYTGTLQDLADLTGIHSITVCRILKKLVDKRLLIKSEGTHTTSYKVVKVVG